MAQGIDFSKAAPDGLKAMLHLQQYVENSGLEPPLMELVKMRASQINGCAYGLDMHSKDARAAGETEQRLYALGAWRETPLYGDRERAALAWTEALTRIVEDEVSDALYADARKQFSGKGTGRSSARDQRDQRLEPPRDPVPIHPGHLPTARRQRARLTRTTPAHDPKEKPGYAADIRH